MTGPENQNMLTSEKSSQSEKHDRKEQNMWLCLPDVSVLVLFDRLLPLLFLASRTVCIPFLFITRDDVVSQRLKFGSAFLSSSWESKIALFF